MPRKRTQNSAEGRKSNERGRSGHSMRQRGSSSQTENVATETRAERRHQTQGSSSHKTGGRSRSLTTTDHDEIRKWAEERGGIPAAVKGTGGNGDTGIVRIEFPGTPNAKEDELDEISWEDFFQQFDENGLALVYQETTAAGEKSNFNKIVKRDSASKTRPSGKRSTKSRSQPAGSRGSKRRIRSS